jgi:APA family basic amino acid/polyamine antiporter
MAKAGNRSTLGFWGRAFRRYSLKKSPESVIAQSQDPSQSLKKSLTGFDLTVLGVGAIIGAGIFALSGTGAQTAGPYVVFAFIVAGFICVLVGLAYSEMASTIPTSGSAYAYSYSALGETLAWVLGWALVIEYAVGSAAVAVAWSANFVAFLESMFGWSLPAALTNSALAAPGVGIVNLPALIVVLLIGAVLVVGAKETARLTTVFVFIKVGVILFVVAVGIFFIRGANLALTPPPPDPNAWFSVLGTVGPIIGAAAIIFFAYIGFDAVSTTAEETVKPKRDLPIGILGSLAICTVLYVLASTTLVGMVPYTDFLAGGDVSQAEAQQRIGEPFGYAFEAVGITWAANLVRLGAMVGLASVMMVLLLGGPRVFFALARDGLLPRSWSKVHSRFGTPYRTTIGTAVGVALAAGFGSLGVLASLVNIGTLFAFTLVCVATVVLRYTKPGLERPFRVPLNIGRLPVLAVAGAVLCLGLMFSLPGATLLAFFAWMGIGLMFYALYGIRKSRLHQGAPASAGPPPGGTVAEGPGDAATSDSA